MGIMDTLRRITLVEMVTGQDQVDFGPLRLPSHEKLRALDQAHEQGFRAFLSDIGHDGRNVGHRHWASNALVALMNGVQGQGPDVDYDDPYTAAAYLVKYHLRHCILAYWAFRNFLTKKAFLMRSMSVMLELERAVLALVWHWHCWRAGKI